MGVEFKWLFSGFGCVPKVLKVLPLSGLGSTGAGFQESGEHLIHTKVV